MLRLSAQHPFVSMDGKHCSYDERDILESFEFKTLSDDIIRLAADIRFDEDELSGEGEQDLFGEEEDDVMMPPPKPMFDRRNSAPAGIQTGLNLALSQARSASPRKPYDAEYSSKRSLQRVVSLPNLQYDRSIYNRSVGITMLASVTERNELKGRNQAQRRALEFDDFLNDL